jgi:hypothetical protein
LANFLRLKVLLDGLPMTPLVNRSGVGDGRAYISIIFFANPMWLRMASV